MLYVALCDCGSAPPATVRPGRVLGSWVKDETLHAAVAPLEFPGVADADVHCRLTALTGTVVQPENVVAVVPALMLHVPPLLLLLMVNATVAAELPAMLVPGEVALKVMVAGVALTPVMVVEFPLPPDAIRIGAGRLAIGIDRWARAGITA